MSSGMPLQTSGYGGGYDPSISSASLSASNQSSYPTRLAPSQDTVDFSASAKPEKKSHVWAWVGGITGAIAAIAAAVGLHSAVGQARIKSLGQEFKDKNIQPLLDCITKDGVATKEPAYTDVKNKKGLELFEKSLLESSHEDFTRLMERRKADFGDDNYNRIIAHHRDHGIKPEPEKKTGESS